MEQRNDINLRINGYFIAPSELIVVSVDRFCRFRQGVRSFPFSFISLDVCLYLCMFGFSLSLIALLTIHFPPIPDGVAVSLTVQTNPSPHVPSICACMCSSIYYISQLRNIFIR